LSSSLLQKCDGGNAPLDWQLDRRLLYNFILVYFTIWGVGGGGTWNSRTAKFYPIETDPNGACHL
jgi:hypothetical protein